MWNHMISCDIIWSHMISYDITGYHRISHDIIDSSESTVEQNVGTRFLNFIIFLYKIMLENMSLLEKYHKNKFYKFIPKNSNSALNFE